MTSDSKTALICIIYIYICIYIHIYVLYTCVTYSAGQEQCCHRVDPGRLAPTDTSYPTGHGTNSHRTPYLLLSSLKTNNNSKNVKKLGRQNLQQFTAFTLFIDRRYYRVGHKKRGTLLLSISSPIIDGFSQSFHWHTLQTICYNVIITYPTTP